MDSKLLKAKLYGTANCKRQSFMGQQIKRQSAIWDSRKLKEQGCRCRRRLWMREEKIVKTTYTGQGWKGREEKGEVGNHPQDISFVFYSYGGT
jgi:hypothetical protein